MSDIERPRAGDKGTAALRVGTGDTAAALGSGDMAVLGTPRVLALAEQATVAALDGRLEPGTTSVGTGIRLRHRAASPVGASVTATAELRESDGRRLVFHVAVADGADPERLLADGEVERVVVDRERFLAAVAG
ncbi:thioesterase family protein [Nocardiopsis coralliicola]